MKTQNKKKTRDNLSIWVASIAYVMFLLTCVFCYTVDFITEDIQVDSFSQFLYTVQVGMGGAGVTVLQILWGFVNHYLFWILCATLLYGLFMYFALRERKARQLGQKAILSQQTVVTLNSTVIFSLFVCGAVSLNQIFQGYEALKIGDYIEEQSVYSTLYEDKYVEPDPSLLTFPEKKKNLVYIYLESMENSFTDKAHGGGYDVALIPELTALAKEHTDFSAKDDTALNGGQVTNQTGWTVAGMVAQTSGTPLGVSRSKYSHSFDENMLFMPKVVSLGDILQANGYQNVFMCGSEASYAGRKNYFVQHGDYKILDLDEAHESGKLPPNYHEWWGYEDSKLIDYAKDELTQLANSDQPFNFTMITADTHFLNGYKCPDCPNSYEHQYENVIACSDHRIAEFVRWMSQQDFYEDTVIVISGDHLSMDGVITEEIGFDYPRKSFFTVINGPEYTLDQTREFTTLDQFPTTMEAMGIQIDGHRLGLGTSLYANVPTLCEEIGFDQLNSDIAHRSHKFEEEIMKDDGLEATVESNA